MTMSFEDLGSGRPVVLLHAFPLSRTMWQGQIEPLTASGFRLIIPDLRGFGENNSFADLNSMEDMARDVGQLLESLEIQRAIIGGLSMGGYVTFNLFRLFPEKFAALVLCDTSPAADTEEKRRARFDLIEKIEEQGPTALVENVLPNLISDYTKEHKPELFADLEKEFARINPKAAVAALRGMAERRDHSELLGTVSRPVLLLFGADDKVTNIETARAMHEQIPDSAFFTIENAGHFANLEQPSEFNELLLNFCRSVDF